MLKILIPVDGSELSLDALRHALQLVAQGLHAEFVLANVQEPASLYEVLVARDPQVLDEVSRSAGDHLLEGARWLCESAGVAYECEIAHGDPAHTLVDIAERYACDAVIMGARGQGGLLESLLGTHMGSVSQAVAQACAVPVTVVKHVQPQEPPEGEVQEPVEAT